MDESRLRDTANAAWLAVGLVRATVPATAGAVVVKTAWKRQVTGRLVVRRIPDLNPAAKNGQETLFDTCSACFFDVNAVNGISTTSARETQVLVGSSKRASVYSMVVQRSSPMVAIAALTLGSMRTVTETSAPPRRTALTTSAP